MTDLARIFNLARGHVATRPYARRRRVEDGTVNILSAVGEAVREAMPRSGPAMDGARRAAVGDALGALTAVAENRVRRHPGGREMLSYGGQRQYGPVRDRTRGGLYPGRTGPGSALYPEAPTWFPATLDAVPDQAAALAVLDRALGILAQQPAPRWFPNGMPDAIRPGPLPPIPTMPATFPPNPWGFVSTKGLTMAEFDRIKAVIADLAAVKADPVAVNTALGSLDLINRQATLFGDDPAIAERNAKVAAFLTRLLPAA